MYGRRVHGPPLRGPGQQTRLAIVKGNWEDFAERFRGCTVLMDKGYIDGGFAEEMREEGVKYIAIKRRNMIKTDEAVYYRILNRVRTLIETRFSPLEEYGLRFVRAVTRKGLAIKVITATLDFNIYPMMETI
ncbi:MAG: transposase [Candidatus Bathyarchaeia archaeon]